MRRRILTWLTASLIAVTGCALFAALASASTGAFTSSTASSDWTTASFSGSVTWDGCTGNNAGPNCSWTPVITAQPSLDLACTGTEAISGGDPDFKLLWSGGAQTTNATIPFNESAVATLDGVIGQRLCLSVIWTNHFQDPVCLAQAPILGIDPSTCPVTGHPTGTAIASALLTQQDPPATAPTTPPVAPPTTVAPPVTTTPIPAPEKKAERAVPLSNAYLQVTRALHRKIGGYRGLSDSCHRVFSSRFSCRVRVRDRTGRRWSGTVVVWRTGTPSSARWHSTTRLTVTGAGRPSPKRG